ncbi:MAG: acetyl-CoA C-acetyltransferase [Bdellovibrionota bacterium]
MSKTMRKVAILGGKRTPFVKSMGAYQKTTNQQMFTEVLNNLVTDYKLEGKKLGDVAGGALITNSADWNLTRESILGTKLHPHTPGYNVQRACSTSLDTSLQIALKIAAGQIDVGIAGGSDTNSDVPVTFSRSFAWKMIELRNAKNFMQKLKVILSIRPKDLKPHFPNAGEKRTGKSMGDHCEMMVKEWKIPREAQDELTFISHQNAAKAYKEGFYEDMVINFKGLKRDGILREDTTKEKLAKLKPAFDKTSGQGTLTAGNSTPLTDGASAVLMASEEWAKANNLPVLAYFVDAQVAALDFVHGEGLLMAPTIAVSELLKRNNLTLQDFDFYEIHEAFAGQVLCTLKAWEDPDYCKKVLGRDKPLGSIDRSKMNVKGGSVALGHPFAATGARIVASLAKILNQNGKGRGLISVCTAGGMGVVAIVEK